MLEGNKVLIYSSEFPPCKGSGGIGNHAFNLARMFQKNSFSVQVLSETFFLKENPYTDTKLGFNVFYIKRWRGLLITYFSRIYYLLKFSGNANLVVISGAVPVVFSLCLKWLRFNKAICIVAHGTELTLGGKLKLYLTRLSLSYAKYIVAVSGYTKKHIPDKLKGKTTVIPNGYYIPETINNCRIASHEALTLLTVGSTSYRKGQLNVIRALPEIKKKHPNVHYIIIGSLGLKDEIEALARELKVIDSVSFRGKVDNAELYEGYRNADIFLMLSEHTQEGDFEGFGIAILEANHFGLPAIGSLGTGIEDAILTGYNGVLVNPKSSTEIAESIELILNNFDKFSDQSRDWAQKHQWEQIFPKYLKVF